MDQQGRVIHPQSTSDTSTQQRVPPAGPPPIAPPPPGPRRRIWPAIVAIALVLCCIGTTVAGVGLWFGLPLLRGTIDAGKGSASPTEAAMRLFLTFEQPDGDFLTHRYVVHSQQSMVLKVRRDFMDARIADQKAIQQTQPANSKSQDLSPATHPRNSATRSRGEPPSPCISHGSTPLRATLAERCSPTAADCYGRPRRSSNRTAGASGHLRYRHGVESKANRSPDTPGVTARSAVAGDGARGAQTVHTNRERFLATPARRKHHARRSDSQPSVLRIPSNSQRTGYASCVAVLPNLPVLNQGVQPRGPRSSGPPAPPSASRRAAP